MLEWKLTKDSSVDFADAISHHVHAIAKKAFPDLLPFFPSGAAGQFKLFLGSQFICGWVELNPQSPIWVGGGYTETYHQKDLATLVDQLPDSKDCIWSPEQLHDVFPYQAYSSNRFTYAGPYLEPYADWPNMMQHINHWIEHDVIPSILTENETRIRRVIRPACPIKPLEVLKSVYPIECENTIKQGTGFISEKGQMITCAHVLGSNSVVIGTAPVGPTYPVKITSQDETIDLAILKVNNLPIGNQLEIGCADNLQTGDNLYLVSYPNYRKGDTGMVTPGVITGFRMVSGIRRILTNIPIIAGASGSPVLHENRVIGVAVTGADRMEDAHTTEDHGIIPIDALKYL
ncbi:MAG: serine protease [Cyanobacteria bacterium P01_D01_bin.156]